MKSLKTAKVEKPMYKSQDLRSSSDTIKMLGHQQDSHIKIKEEPSVFVNDEPLFRV